jgi:hypothetical protein
MDLLWHHKDVDGVLSNIVVIYGDLYTKQVMYSVPRRANRACKTYIGGSIAIILQKRTASVLLQLQNFEIYSPKRYINSASYSVGGRDSKATVCSLTVSSTLISREYKVTTFRFQTYRIGNCPQSYIGVRPGYWAHAAFSRDI